MGPVPSLYRWFQKDRINSVWLSFFLLIWAGFQVYSWIGNEAYEETERDEVLWRVLITDYTLSQSAAEWNPVFRWISGIEVPKGFANSSANYLERTEREGRLSIEHSVALESLIELREREGVSHESINESESGEGFEPRVTPWEVMVRTSLHSQNPHSEDALSNYRKFRETLGNRVFVLTFLWCVILLVGAFCLPTVIRSIFHIKSLAPSFPITLWSPKIVLLVFLIGVLAENLIYEGGYIAAGIVFMGSEEWPEWLYIVMDTVWRVTAAITVIMLLFAKPAHAAKVFGVFRKIHWKHIFGMLALMWIVNTGLYHGFNALEMVDWEEAVLLSEDGWMGLFYGILSAVILAPICEEIVYRGALLGGFQRKFSFWPAAILSTVFFVIIHYYDPYGCASIFCFGLAACVLYRATGSLSTAITFHAITNALYTADSWLLYNQPYS